MQKKPISIRMYCIWYSYQLLFNTLKNILNGKLYLSINMNDNNDLLKVRNYGVYTQIQASLNSNLFPFLQVQ